MRKQRLAAIAWRRPEDSRQCEVSDSVADVQRAFPFDAGIANQHVEACEAAPAGSLGRREQQNFVASRADPDGRGLEHRRG